MVARLQSVISEEIKKQLQEKEGRDYPDYLIACVGGGSNAAGTIYHYINDERVGIILAEAGGKGIETGMTAATIQLGKMGIIHGARTYVIQNEDGQIEKPCQRIGNQRRRSDRSCLRTNQTRRYYPCIGIRPCIRSFEKIEVQTGRYRCIDCFRTRRQRY